jgi:hypothetical protein
MNSKTVKTSEYTFGGEFQTGWVDYQMGRAMGDPQLSSCNVKLPSHQLKIFLATSNRKTTHKNLKDKLISVSVLPSFFSGILNVFSPSQATLMSQDS